MYVKYVAYLTPNKMVLTLFLGEIQGQCLGEWVLKIDATINLTDPQKSEEALKVVSKTETLKTTKEHQELVKQQLSRNIDKELIAISFLSVMRHSEFFR